MLQRGGSRAWLLLIVLTLNFLYGNRSARYPALPGHGPATAAQEAALAHLEEAAEIFLQKNKGVLEPTDWEKALRGKRIDYHGDEVGTPSLLTLKQVEKLARGKRPVAK